MPHIMQYLILYGKSFKFVWNSSKGLTFLLILLVPLQALIPSASLLIVNQIVNNFVDSTKDNIIYLVAWGFLFILGNVLLPFGTYLQGKLTDHLTYALNSSIMSKAADLQTISWYENPEFHNKIELLSSEASWRPVNLLVFGTSLLSNSILLFSMVLLLVRYHWIIAILMLGALIPQSMLSYKIQQQAFETLVSSSEDSRKLKYYSNTILNGKNIKDVRLFNLYNFFGEKYRNTFQKIKMEALIGRKRKIIVTTLFLFLTGMISVGGFVYIIFAVKHGGYEVGSIIVYTSSIVYTIQASSRLVEDSSLLYDTLMYMKSFFEFLGIEDDIKFGEKNLPNKIGKLEFRNVNFAYNSKKESVLKNISFEINYGEKIAIVGENGSGKSTLIKLLLQFYPLTSGEILIDGHNVTEYSIEQYRKYFSAIFQDFARFDLTVEENIKLSDLSKKEDISRILMKTGLGSEFNLTANQQLGKLFDSSRELSGGQWQKIALARAFFADKPFLILDEPTASLDARTEKMIFNQFLELSQNKTVIFVTHRLSMVKKADKVLVLKNGEIVAFDTHSQLMMSNEYYKELYMLQASSYVEG